MSGADLPVGLDVRDRRCQVPRLERRESEDLADRVARRAAGARS